MLFNIRIKKCGYFYPHQLTIKKEIYDTYIKDKYYIATVFDDRNKVVDMWRKEGLLCCQVAEGDF